ncbi:MAG: phage holin family protein [Candidatus Zixiibacteriota bacterium]|nr:MAG: phage holin family protein [candidate division Zixibacteria bacterium]
MKSSKSQRFLVKLLVTVAALLIVVKISPWAEVEDPVALIVTALLLGIFNTILRPLLILLTLPINILSFGLFILVINGLILYIISLLVPGFNLSGFGAAVLTSILVSLTAWVINMLIKDRE